MTFQPKPGSVADVALTDVPPPGALAAWHDDRARDGADQTRRRILQALGDGSLCGTSIDGRIAACLLALLDRLGWTPCYDALGRALPHLPTAFSADDLREVCARLGYPSEGARLSAGEIEPSRLPALLLGPAPRLLQLGADGSVEVVDPVTGERRRFTGRRRHDVAFFDLATDDDEAPPAPGSWLGTLLRRLGGTIRLLFALVFVINSMILVTSLTIMAIYDLVLPALAYDALVALSVGAVFVVAFELALRRIRARLLGHLAGRVEYALGCGLFSKLVSLPLERISTVPVSSQVARLKQFEGVRDLFAGSLAVILLELPFALLFTGVLFVVAGKVGFVPLALVVGSAVVGGALFPIARRRAAAAHQARSAYQELMLDTLGNLRPLRNLGCQAHWEKRLDKAAVDAAKAKRASVEIRRLLSVISTAAPPLAGGATVALGALMVMDGELSTGALVACMIVVWRVVSPVQQALLMLPRISDLSRLSKQIDMLMAMPGEDQGRPKRTAIKSCKGRVTLAHAAFRYPGASEPAIAGVDLDVRPGELLAVSGPSGAGKTTLLNLVQGLITPQAGIVALDGRNLRQLPIDHVRGTIGFVAHDPAFFHGTVEQNLRLAAPSASDHEIEGVLDELGILGLLRDLPDGLATRLTEARQAHLPRGARQALALARTLLRRPSVLLLDEPAQSLDPALEQAFLDTVAARRGQATILMVSHRPSHLRIADRVLQMERGRVAALRSPNPDTRTPAS